MIQRGYRRFFEDVEPAKNPAQQLGMYGRKYAASLCHAWAGAAPVMAISCGVLGIQPLAPGYRVCRIAPQRCRLEKARGAVPCPGGTIAVEWTGSMGEVVLPAEVTAQLNDGREVKGPGKFSFSVA
jgi:hypothetical protein